MALLTAKLHIPLLALLMLGALLGLYGPAPEKGGENPHVAGAEAVLLINGQPRLAERRYNEVAYATTHNANASAAHEYFFPNQMSNMRQQLDDGIRALMIDLHQADGEVMFCHGDCRLGKQSIGSGLGEIAGFLDAHPNEVVTLLLETYQIPAKTLARAFAESGLLKHAYAHTPDTPWPTLREMVHTGQRLVVFTDRDNDGYPWLHPMWDSLWDTPWNVSRIEDFSCMPSRGTQENDLFVLNHFILNPLPLPHTAEAVNSTGVLLERALACWNDSRRIPNFVTVDYYELGDVVAVVEALNALAARG
jgi:hypothetical protein